MTLLCLIDESNFSPTPIVRFYVTGALVVPLDLLHDLNEGVEGIRRTAGFRPEDDFKWDTRSRPPHVSEEAHRHAKSEVIDTFPGYGAVFLPALTSHFVAAKKSVQTRVEWGANMAVRMWEQYLEAKGERGACLLDRRPAGNDGAYLRSLFARRPGDPPGRDFSLKRTLVLGYTMAGASHLSSVLDVVLGGFCYAVNERRAAHKVVASSLLKRITRGMWLDRQPDGGARFNPGAVSFLPMKPTTPGVEREFVELTAHLDRLMKTPGPA